MDNEKVFLMLDIDGVLLEARGYWLSCVDTINDFLSKMGQNALSVDESIHDAYDSSGITTEWDMVPLTLAAFVNWYCEVSGTVPEEGAFPPYCGEFQIGENESFRKMLLEQIRVYSGMLDPDDTCINAIYHCLQKHNGGELKYLWDLPYRDRFFVDTLDPWRSPCFAALMTRVLGSRIFRDFYGMEAPFACDSYLETEDRLLISEYYRKLLPEIHRFNIFPAIMTYRPTKLPENDGNFGSSYFVNTPEGESALDLLGWDDRKVPMIGAGSLCHIEDKYGLRRENYVKPHPFHALASFAISLCHDEIRALETARVLCESDPERSPSPVSEWLSPGENLTLVVFEDSLSGIRSVRTAAEVLKKWGYNAKAEVCGIRTTEKKAALLKSEDVSIYPDVNSAFDIIFERCRLREREGNI
ncbi:MAG: hypothetical protein IKP86_01455 [Anaerolineaceae bacterium]|nr:hypothetical protein [Anaerolineaceae bacterium]